MGVADKKTATCNFGNRPTPNTAPRTTPLDCSSITPPHRRAHAVSSRYLNNDGFQHAQNRNTSLAVRSNLCGKCCGKTARCMGAEDFMNRMYPSALEM
eukprot:scaffold3089_cov114-Skeletonema_marinoi.AAC.1